MTFEVAGEFTKRLQSLDWERARFRPRRVEQRRCVTLRQHETIIHRVLRIRDFVAHSVEEHRGRDQRPTCNLSDVRSRLQKSQRSSESAAYCPSFPGLESSPCWFWQFVPSVAPR